MCKLSPPPPLTSLILKPWLRPCSSSDEQPPSVYFIQDCLKHFSEFNDMLLSVSLCIFLTDCACVSLGPHEETRYFASAHEIGIEEVCFQYNSV